MYLRTLRTRRTPSLLWETAGITRPGTASATSATHFLVAFLLAWLVGTRKSLRSTVVGSKMPVRDTIAAYFCGGVCLAARNV